MALAVPVRFRPSADLVGANHEYNNRDTVSIDRHKSFLALIFMIRDKGNKERMKYALTVRIALSILLFFFLIFSYKMGG